MDETATIGVAMGIPHPWAEILDAARAGAGDPLAEFIPAHLTLLGPTEIAIDRMDDVIRHLTRVAEQHPRYTLRLHGTGTFRPITEVVFVVVVSGIVESERLAAATREGLLTREPKYSYHPHVTIAHDVPTEALDRVHAELADFDASFAVDHFTLYVHGDDGRWRPIRDFPLRAAARATRADRSR